MKIFYLIFLFLAMTIEPARGESVLVWGDSHWHEINNNVQHGPVQYLEQWGHEVDCECYGGRGLHHWPVLEWQLPRPDQVFIIALMSNDILVSSKGVNYFDVYIQKLDTALSYHTGRTLLVLPTVFRTRKGAVTENDVHLWRYLVAIHVLINHPHVELVDAQRSGQRPGADGLHYDDAYLYARHLNEVL